MRQRWLSGNTQPTHPHMKTKAFSESGVYNLRLASTLALCLGAAWLSVLSFAAPSPASGTLSTSSGPLTFTDSSPLVNNPTGEGVGFSKPTCTAPNTCSTYTLTLDPSLFAASGNYDPANNNILIQISWPVSATQYGSFVEGSDGSVIASNTAGIDPETITIPLSTPNLASKSPLQIVTTAEIGSGPSLTGTITLIGTSAGGQVCNGCTRPRYQMYEAPPGTATRSGEPSIGVDWNPNLQGLKQIAPATAAVGPKLLNTGGITIFTATFDQYRVGFDDCASPAVTSWTDIAFAPQQTASLDAIGFTDHFTKGALGTGPYDPGNANTLTPGRTFHGQLTAGDSNTSYTDDDGKSHTPSQGGGVPQGPDHETFGAGPYAPTDPNANPPVVEPAHPTYQNAVYYCTQNIAPEAECSRSDDGGLSFGPGVPIYTPTQCTGSIHGHVKVARDGTVYVPNYSCTLPTGNQGVAVSTDNGVSWNERNVPGSGSPKPGLVDPSVAIALNDIGKPAGQTTNTIYLGYIDNDGTPKVSASGDRGVHWLPAQNVGADFNLVNTTFPVVVAGDDNRAAFGFLGTTTPGDSSLNANFPGVWHLYIATTYDGGNSWVTIDATPNDPVQVGPVCNGGTTCPTKRNLLDFNGFDVDAEGRGVLGLSDGCVNCTNTSVSGDSNAAQGLIARQSGGPRLFSAFDPVEPAAPAAPQVLSATIQDDGVLISWIEPDNGGSPITAYRIYRGASSGAEGTTPIATVTNDPLNTHTKFLDTTATNPASGSGYFYHVTAVNAIGESRFCEEVATVAGGAAGATACAPPYIQVDGSGSGSTDPTMGELTIQGVNIGEPFTTCDDKSLTYIMQVSTMDPAGTGSAAPAPNGTWQITFNVLDDDGNPRTVFVDMNTANQRAGGTPVTPAFSYGRRDTSAAGGAADTTVCTNGPASSCPDVSGSVSADGTITINLKDNKLSFAAPTIATGTAFTWTPKAGDKLSSIEGETTILVGAAGTGAVDSVQTTGATGTYTMEGNAACSGKLPTAVLSATPSSGTAPLSVSFDASGSNEPSGACGTIASYTLAFGDGTTPVTQPASSPTFTHTYQNPGNYNASLIVTDSLGQTSTNPAEVTITATAAGTNHPPVAVLDANPAAGAPPLTVSFDATRSSDPDFSDTIQNYTFSFGDGSGNVSGGHPTVSHTYTSPGTFTARLIVTDSRGASNQNTDTDHVSIMVMQASTPTPTPGGSATPTATPGASATPTATPGGSATPTVTPGGSATPTATPGASATPTPTATPGSSATPSPTPANVSLVNISGRIVVQSGDSVGIGGFIVGGDGTKRIIARALGPSLNVNGTPVSGRLQDPVLELHDSNGNVLTNDNWRDSQEAEIQDTGLAPSDDHEAAIVKRVPAGNYTAIIRSADGTPGIGLIELYDLSENEPGELGNLSVRALVQTDDNVLIDGVILQGGNAKNVLFRALGPELHDRGVQGEIQDPLLELHDANGNMLATNDNWKDAPNASDIQASGLAPTDDHESAILMSLNAGNYTSVVRGVNNTTGVALNEVFKLDSSQTNKN